MIDEARPYRMIAEGTSLRGIVEKTRMTGTADEESGRNRGREW